MGSARSFGDEQDVDFNEDDLLTQEQKKMYFIEILLNNLWYISTENAWILLIIIKHLTNALFQVII